MSDDDLAFVAPLRAGLNSLYFLLLVREGDVPPDVVELIEDIIDQERNS